jgi:uncharacterized protein
MILRGLTAILFLIISNFFMTFAWYGHLQFKKWNVFQTQGLIGLILISWSIAFNRLGFNENGGPFNLFQLKILQEVITLVVFSFCAIFIFKTDKLQWNYLVGFGFLILAVFFIFKKWD